MAEQEIIQEISLFLGLIGLLIAAGAVWGIVHAACELWRLCKRG